VTPLWPIGITLGVSTEARIDEGNGHACVNSVGCKAIRAALKIPTRSTSQRARFGIGATAPIWGALARRYVDAAAGTTVAGRRYSLLGDAELDEGAVWEAVLDPAVAELGEVVWIIGRPGL
jgi:pyruvate dehydrogenase E1 component